MRLIDRILRRKYVEYICTCPEHGESMRIGFHVGNKDASRQLREAKCWTCGGPVILRKRARGDGLGPPGTISPDVVRIQHNASLVDR